LVNAALVAQRQNEEITSLTEAGYEQNEQVKRISSWAAILFALTRVASIFGMNSIICPSLGWQLGYPFSIWSCCCWVSVCAQSSNAAAGL
jgi:magnesium transporter